MLGSALNLPSLKGLGLASCAAPYTKVFCQASTRDGDQSFETFAADFIIHYQQANGDIKSIRITPEIYQNLQGSYQRRNVYGAVLAYGPALPETVQQSTFSYALESPGSITEELGIPHGAQNIQVEIISKSNGSHQRWTLHGNSH